MAEAGVIRSLFVRLGFKVDSPSLGRAERAVDGVAAAARDAAAAFGRTDTALDKTTTSARETSVAVKQTDVALDSAATSAGRMATQSERANRQMRDARGRFAATGRSADGLTRSGNSLIGTLRGIAAAYIGIETAAAGARTIADYQSQIARLDALLGGESAANAKYQELLEFSQQYSLNVGEVVDSFAKLDAFGLNTSDETMLSMANVAAANGKTIKDWMEAVADAATFEFERLKEFGIRARAEGDQVAVQFRGQTTMIEKSASAMQEHLTSLGLNEYAGNVENQAATLGGAFRALKTQLTESLVDVFYDGEGANRRESGVMGSLTDMVRSLGGLAKAIAPIVKIVATALTPAFLGLANILEIVDEHTVFFSTLIGMSGLLFLLPKLVAGIQAAWTAVTALAGSWGALNIAMLLIPVAIALIADDLYAFATGGESAIGSLIDKLREMGPGWAVIADGIEGVANATIGAVRDFHELMSSQEAFRRAWLEMPWNAEAREEYYSNLAGSEASAHTRQMIEGLDAQGLSSSEIADRLMSGSRSTRRASASERRSSRQQLASMDSEYETLRNLYTTDRAAFREAGGSRRIRDLQHRRRSLRERNQAADTLSAHADEQRAAALRLDPQSAIRSAQSAFDQNSFSPWNVAALQGATRRAQEAGVTNNLTVRVDASGAMDAEGVQRAAEEGARAALAEQNADLTRDYAGGEAQ